ncbi:MAG: family 20 glycosylhydrolase [Opitutaceae bacterium]|nr:family 20 glycosylhydrolase [Opitutaceae bacterium]
MSNPDTHRAAPGWGQPMPLPLESIDGPGRLAVSAVLEFVVLADLRVKSAAERMRRRWQERTGLLLRPIRSAEGARRNVPSIVIRARQTSPAHPALGDDESYCLVVTRKGARLDAATSWGALRGLATLEQCLRSDLAGWHLPERRIRDRPRFAWRGLLIDVCRHEISVESLKRQIDGMALAKFNVLHFHLTNDQGFRIESRRFPRLHEYGSDGFYYTQQQIREIISHASNRGIRVVPEFDVPAHTSSWLVGHPELASAPGPHEICRTWGVVDAVLNPAQERTYRFLESLFGEMVTLFPDDYFHIGGDEVKAKQWNENADIQRFLKKHSLRNNRGLQAHFNQRLSRILKRLGRKMVGWDEILHPELPKDTVIQSWRGMEGLREATRHGCQALLSNGYYLDLWWPAGRHYSIDPIPEDSGMDAGQQERVLGGEAAMWNEWTTEERLDFAIWPRAAAVAERLWSPAGSRDTDGMYKRLGAFSRHLEFNGLQHESSREVMLRRFAGEADSWEVLEALRITAEAFEPVKNYGRNQAQPDVTQFHPLTGFADFLRVESDAAREFGDEVEAWIDSGGGDSQSLGAMIERKVDRWMQAAAVLPDLLASSGRAKEIIPAVDALRTGVSIARAALRRLGRKCGSATWRGAQHARVTAVCQPRGHFQLALERPLRLLVAAASVPKTGFRNKASLQAWRRQVLMAAKLAAPVGSPVYEQWM